MAANAQVATLGPVAPIRPALSRRARRGRAVPLILLAAVLFLGYGSRTIAAPFGDAHDGRNAGVWAAGSQSLREEGPVASRLGTRSPLTGVYANHPPLIYLETTLAQVVGGSSTAATRAPAWAGSLLLIGLLYLLLKDRGLASGAVGVAVLLAVATPMFLVYGTMLDTPVTSLPLGVGLLVIWERARRGDRAHPLVATGLAALAVLAGWQTLLLAFVLAGWALVRVVRGTGRRATNLAFAAGAAVGFGLLLAWLLWAFGGTLRPMLDQFLIRTGEKTERVSFSALLGAQQRTLLMFGAMGIAAAAGLVAAFRDARTRGLAAVSLAVTVPYAVVFRTGAVNHDYWGYWFLLPVAVGLAAGADRALAYWRSRGRPETVPVAAAVVVACLSVFTAWVQPPTGESLKLNGLRAAEAVQSVPLEAGQRTMWFAGAIGQPGAWLALATGRPAAPVRSSEYAALAASSPNDLVLVGEVRCAGGRNDHTYALRPAGTFGDRPPTIAPC